MTGRVSMELDLFHDLNSASSNLSSSDIIV